VGASVGCSGAGSPPVGDAASKAGVAIGNADEQAAMVAINIAVTINAAATLLAIR
jgi:hypothetical protein